VTALPAWSWPDTSGVPNSVAKLLWSTCTQTVRDSADDT
jgi:hypothetical protein